VGKKAFFTAPYFHNPDYSRKVLKRKPRNTKIWEEITQIFPSIPISFFLVFIYIYENNFVFYLKRRHRPRFKRPVKLKSRKLNLKNDPDSDGSISQEPTFHHHNPRSRKKKKRSRGRRLTHRNRATLSGPRNHHSSPSSKKHHSSQNQSQHLSNLTSIQNHPSRVSPDLKSLSEKQSLTRSRSAKNEETESEVTDTDLLFKE
jgi:hypothetical protein